MEKRNSTRRQYLRSAGAAAVGSTIFSETATAKQKDSISETQNDSEIALEKIPHDIAVSNSGYENHKISVQMENQDDSKIEYKHQFVLPGLNNPAKNDSAATLKRGNINVPTGTTYNIQVQLENGESTMYEWYIPTEGTELINLNILVTPEEKIQISDVIA